MPGAGKRRLEEQRLSGHEGLGTRPSPLPGANHGQTQGSRASGRVPEEVVRLAKGVLFCEAPGTHPRWGVHSLPAILDGEPLKGYWFSRTQEYAARRRRESFGRYDYATEVTVHLAPLPCWKGLSPEQYQRRAAALETSIEEEAARERETTGETVLGAEAVVSRDPHHRPEKMDRSPAPRFHTATESARRLLYDAYSEFLAAFRVAAAKLKAGDRASPFPRGSFPPGLPFVTA